MRDGRGRQKRLARTRVQPVHQVHAAPHDGLVLLEALLHGAVDGVREGAVAAARGLQQALAARLVARHRLQDGAHAGQRVPARRHVQPAVADLRSATSAGGGPTAGAPHHVPDHVGGGEVVKLADGREAGSDGGARGIPEHADDEALAAGGVERRGQLAVDVGAVRRRHVGAAHVEDAALHDDLVRHDGHAVHVGLLPVHLRRRAWTGGWAAGVARLTHVRLAAKHLGRRPEQAVRLLRAGRSQPAGLQLPEQVGVVQAHAQHKVVADGAVPRSEPAVEAQPAAAVDRLRATSAR